MPFNITVGGTFAIKNGPNKRPPIELEQINEIQRQTLVVDDYALPATDQGAPIPYLMGTRIINKALVMGYGFVEGGGITPVYDTKIEETTENETVIATTGNSSGGINPSGWRWKEAPYEGYDRGMAAVVDTGAPNPPVNARTTTIVHPQAMPTSPGLSVTYPPIGFQTVAVDYHTTVKNHTINTITTLVGYTFDIMLAVCLGAGVRLRKIYSGDVLLWEGDIYGDVDVDVSGIEGRPLGTGFSWHSGMFDQPKDAYLLSKATDPERVSAYPGIAYIVLKNVQSSAVGQAAFSFECTRIPEPLAIPRNITTANELDINPAVALAMLLVDQWGGYGIRATDIDLAYSFGKAAYICHNEGASCSFLITAETGGSSIVKQLQDQMNGIMFTDPAKDLIRFELLRDVKSFTPSLARLDKSNATVQSFKKQDWADMPTHFSVTYSDRAKKYGSTPFVEANPSTSPAGPEELGDRSKRVEAHGLDIICTEEAAAATMLAYMRSGGAPLINMTLVCNRDTVDLVPTDLVQVTFPELKLDHDYFIVKQRREDGNLESSVIDIVQYQYLDVDKYFISPAISAAIPMSAPPADIASMRVIELPYFLLKKNGYSPRYSVPTLYGEALILCEAANELQSHVDIYNADSGRLTKEYVRYAPTAKLVYPMDKRHGYQEGIIPEVWITDFKLSGMLFDQGPNGVRRGDIIMFLDDEILAYEKIEYDEATKNLRMFNVHRALIDTVEASHAAGTTIYFHNTADTTRIWQGGLVVNQDTRNLKPVGHTLNGGMKIEDSHVIVNYAPVGRANPPLRPHRITLDGRRDVKRVNVEIGPLYKFRWNLRTRDPRTLSLVNDTSDFPEILQVDDAYDRNPVIFIYFVDSAGVRTYMDNSVTDIEAGGFDDDESSLSFCLIEVPPGAALGPGFYEFRSNLYNYTDLHEHGLSGEDAIAGTAIQVATFDVNVEPTFTFKSDMTIDYGRELVFDMTIDYHADYSVFP